MTSTRVLAIACAAAAVACVAVGAQQLNEACGGRSQQPTVPCENDVRKMMATLALVPEKPPAAPQKPRKVLIWSRIPSAGFQHSSIPLAARLIEELGKRTGAWTSETAWDLAAVAPDKLAQYDAIFLSSTTGAFLDDGDQAGTAARRQALLDFIRGGKGIAGIHATGDSYHGDPQSSGGGRGGAGPCAVATSQRGASNEQMLWPDWDRIIGGTFKFHWVYPQPITVKIDDPSNPVVAPFKGKSFDVADEVYTFDEASFSRSNVHVLMSIDYDRMSDCDKGLEQYPRTDHDYALSWIRAEGKGRFFYQALGHHESIYYNNPAMLAHILAGMQYALGDLKADDAPGKR